MAFKVFRNGAHVTSVCGARGRVVDFTSIGGDEYYIVQVGAERRNQIMRQHNELSIARKA